MGSVKKYYDIYGQLPFKIYNKNGIEVLLLELDKKKEVDFINKLDKMVEMINERYYRFLVYGEDFILTDKEMEDILK